MRALVVQAHPSSSSYCAAVCDAAVRGLRTGGHDVRVHHLYAEGFAGFMSRAERIAYHTTEPIISDEIDAHVADLKWAEALVFVYPTWWAGLPAILKSWFERTMLPDVAFRFDDNGKVKPALTHIRRIVAITTYGGTRRASFLVGDGGKRIITRALRLSCGFRVRSTWLGLYGVDRSNNNQRSTFLKRVEQRLARL